MEWMLRMRKRKAIATAADPILHDLALEGSLIPVDITGHNMLRLDLDARTSA